MRWALLLVLACACEKPDTVPSSIKRIEKKLGKQLDGVVFVRQGIYVDRVFVTDTQFPDALGKLEPRELLDIYLLDDPEPATTIIGALQVVADMHPLVRIHMGIGDDKVAELCARVKLSSQQAAAGADNVALSVLFNPDEAWVGLSRVNEFQHIPRTKNNARDYEKLETVLKEHKASAFFADRRDLELSADPHVTSEDFANGISVACRAGWTELSLLRVDQISARPIL